MNLSEGISMKLETIVTFTESFGTNAPDPIVASTPPQILTNPCRLAFVAAFDHGT